MNLTKSVHHTSFGNSSLSGMLSRRLIDDVWVHSDLDVPFHGYGAKDGVLRCTHAAPRND
jgi:hypothetical protein